MGGAQFLIPVAKLTLVTCCCFPSVCCFCGFLIGRFAAFFVLEPSLPGFASLWCALVKNSILSLAIIIVVGKDILRAQHFTRP